MPEEEQQEGHQLYGEVSYLIETLELSALVSNSVLQLSVMRRV